MAADDVWREAFLFQLLAEFCAGFGPDRFRFGIDNQRMGVVAIASFGLINAMVITLCFGDAAFTHSHGNNRVARLPEQLLADMNVLTWKGLVNEQNIHALAVKRQGPVRVLLG